MVTNRVKPYLDAMEAKKAKKVKLIPFAEKLDEILTEWVKTHKMVEIDRSGVISVTMVNKIRSGKTVPQKLTRTLRALCLYLGYDPEALWIGKLVAVKQVKPPDPKAMFAALLETDRKDKLIDMVATYYRDEFLSGIDP